MGNGRVREKDNGEGCVEVGRTTLDLGEEERAGLLRLLKARRSAPRASRAASRPSVHEVARSSDGGGAHRADRDSDRPACHGPPGWDTWLPSVWLFSAPVRVRLGWVEGGSFICSNVMWARFHFVHLNS
ncbi:hypothetical protein GW17_00006227 [Ensete ventricosum]|nr:hypothetical protein GW17_00006227 [Ensete ventricosum]RZR94789.1 hypothetical protein BHM03_00023539 [Ensete ventricosum]